MVDAALAVDAPRPRAHHTGTVSTVCFAGAAVYVLFLVFVRAGGFSHEMTAPLVAPLLVAITLPALARQAAREDDPTLFRFLVVALLVKLAAGVARHQITYGIYGHSDAGYYHYKAVVLSREYGFTSLAATLHPLRGTNFIVFITALLYRFTGPSMLTGYVVYAWLGFIGKFFFYRAFVIALPQGRPRSYAKLLFFLPGLLFWDSSIGKEAIMVLALGVASYGAARAYTDRMWRGVFIAAAGVVLASYVRVHVAMIFAIAFSCGLFLKPASRRLREMGLGAMVKGVILVPVLLGCVLLVSGTNTFFQHAHLGPSATSVASAGSVEKLTEQGHSNFDAPSVIGKPTRTPLAVITLLFRPFPWEVHNGQQLLASLERMFLLGFVIARRKWLRTAFRSLRRQPYLAFALGFAALFIVAYSSIGNFGILNRQSVQFIPLVIVFFCIPPPDPELREDRSDAAVPA